MNSSQTACENSDPSYFDLHTKGVGFIQRLRRVRASKGPAYVSLDLIALTGEVGAAERVRFDCNVTGIIALRDVAFIEEHIKSAPPADPVRPDRGPRIQVGFTIADLRYETFTYQNGPKQGTTGVSLKTRLIHLWWLKVNGARVSLPSELAMAAANAKAEAPRREEVETA